MIYTDHFQYSLGDPAGRPPEHFGYYVGSGEESYEAAPFGSNTARALYEEAVERYLRLEGVILPPGYAPQTVAALVVVGGQSEDAGEFTLEVLARLGVTGRALDDLRLMADHSIIESVL